MSPKTNDKDKYVEKVANITFLLEYMDKFYPFSNYLITLKLVLSRTT